MLRTLPQTQDWSAARRLGGIALFTLLTIVGARITIEIGAVPFTLQTLAVVLSGLVLGARDGALSQLAYVALVALNLPVDARMIGAAALFGATGGYIIGFVPAAFAAGWLAERWNKTLVVRWLAGIVGMAVVYAFGFTVLQARTGMSLEATWAAGVAPFLVVDAAKAVVAAALAEGGRALLQRGD
ncbi:MAG: biotin transporter BioY [Chloroflexota bacterium]|nr:biotin transporter BioY [Chloroflexota bacterium]